MDKDLIFQALADHTRRELLDRIYLNGGQSVAGLAKGTNMSRQAVAKHLGILERAELVVARRSGRERLHYLNPLPFSSVVGRWVRRFEKVKLGNLMPPDEEF